MSVNKNIPCHIVLERDPANLDSWLQFETFPEDITESYSTKGYDELGGLYMPQPLFAVYRGGNWGPFNLELNFRAGDRLDSETRRRQEVLRTVRGSVLLSEVERQSVLSQSISTTLQTMIDKVRWCQALAFPLGERTTTSDFDDEYEALRRVGRSSIQQGSFSGATGSIVRKITGFGGEIGQEIGYVPFPPMILIFFGTWWTFRGYVRSVNVTWQGPWHPETVQPYGAIVDLQLQPLVEGIPTYSFIRGDDLLGKLAIDTVLPVKDVQEVADNVQQAKAFRKQIVTPSNQAAKAASKVARQVTQKIRLGTDLGVGPNFIGPILAVDVP